MSANPFGVRPRPRPEDFAQFNAGTRRAIRANRVQGWLDMPRTIPCACGGMFRTEQGLRIHRAQYCRLRAS